MHIAALERDDTTLERMSRESQTAQSEFARGAGLALFERVHTPVTGEPITAANRESFTLRAYELLQMAIESRPDDAEAVWASALLSAQLKRDLPLAIQRVEAAGAKLPLSAELNIAMARLQGASGSLDEMRKSLIEARQLSMSPAQRAELEALLASGTLSR
jgi:hypothetical protein